MRSRAPAAASADVHHDIKKDVTAYSSRIAAFRMPGCR
jgi:hypothetical protein